MRRYRFEDISTPNRRLNGLMTAQGPREAPALEQDCLKALLLNMILAGGLTFIFTWGLLASIYFHRPWHSLQQLPRMPSLKCHTPRDHIPLVSCQDLARWSTWVVTSQL